MAKDLWLPKGYELADGSRIQSLTHSGDAWQIYSIKGSDSILVASLDLAERWCEQGFIEDSLLKKLTFGSASFRSMKCPAKYTLAPVESGKPLHSKVDGLAFSLALKESRKLSNEISFHDAIYVEQYSRLLPTWTLTPFVDDKVVLGTWITGGVVMSTDSFRRLSKLAGWMPQSDLAEVISTAGFDIPIDSGSIANRESHSQRISDEENAISDTGLHEGSIQSSKARKFILPGRPQLESFFNEHIIDIIFNAERYQALGIDFPSAVILYGPPGCGKTYAVERLVEFIDWPSYSIDSNSIGSPYIHETSKKISSVFDKAIDTAPSVIVIDEMESFLSDRQSTSVNVHHVEEVAEFLRRIPEAIKKNVLIIAMTNQFDMIDPAILRRGRFDHKIEVGMPSRIEVASLLKSLLDKLPKADDLEANSLADALTGKPLSDAAFTIREASRLAAKAGKSKLDQESLLAAMECLSQGKEKKSRSIGFVREP